MLARLKSTVRDTLVYSLSNIAPKVVGIILLPLYTAKLALGEFGNWDLLDVTVSILAEIFILGQATSIILLNNSDEYKEKKNPLSHNNNFYFCDLCRLCSFCRSGHIIYPGSLCEYANPSFLCSSDRISFFFVY